MKKKLKKLLEIDRQMKEHEKFIQNIDDFPYYKVFGDHGKADDLKAAKDELKFLQLEARRILVEIAEILKINLRLSKMKEPKRYYCGNGEGMFEDDKNGHWVEYSEHKAIVEQLRTHHVVGRSEQFYCTCSRAKGLDHDEEGMPYCIECQKPVQ